MNSCCGKLELWTYKQINYTSWMAKFTQTDSPKSVRNRCVIKSVGEGLSCHFPFWNLSLVYGILSNDWVRSLPISLGSATAVRDRCLNQRNTSAQDDVGNPSGDSFHSLIHWNNKCGKQSVLSIVNILSLERWMLNCGASQAYVTVLNGFL